MTAVVMEAREAIAKLTDVPRGEFRALFDAHQRRVYTLALRFSGDRTAAEDITQTVFLNLYSNLGEFRREARFATWLYRIVWNAALDHHRRQRVARSARAADDSPADVASPEYELSRAQVRQIVHDAIADLKPEQRMAMLLKYVEGMSHDEIADALGWPLGTVASRMNRAHRSCHGDETHEGKPEALAIFDLRRPAWFRDLNAEQLDGAMSRMEGKATEDESGRFRAFIDTAKRAR